MQTPGSRVIGSLLPHCLRRINRRESLEEGTPEWVLKGDDRPSPLAVPVPMPAVRLPSSTSLDLLTRHTCMLRRQVGGGGTTFLL
jgi:hypothetical protein